MTIFRPALTAAMFGAFALLAPIAAQAANNPVAVVDFGRVYKESTAGKSADTQLKAIQSRIQAELSPDAQSLSNDEKTLGPRFQGKSREQILADLKADKDLQAKYGSYAQRMQNFMAKEDLRNREMQATAQKALADVLTQAQPSIDDAMRAKGASVVLEMNATAAHSPDVDITNDVIARFSQRVSTVPVAKVDLTQRQ